MQVSLEANPRDVEGVWVDYNEEGTVKFKIARAGNPVFLRASDKAEAPYRAKIARNKLSTEKQIDLQCKAMAEGILKDWEGIGSEAGPLDYSEEAAYKVLRHNPDVRTFVLDAATDMDRYREDEIETTAKKSPTTSAGG